jgi:hypothetical protein
VRLAAAIGVIAVTLAAAVYVHQRREAIIVTQQVPVPLPAKCTAGYQSPADVGACLFLGTVPKTKTERVSVGTRHPSWEDPLSVLLSIGGIAVAAGVITYRRPTFANPS